MQIDYVSDSSEIQVMKDGAVFQALNHAFFLETQLRLKGEAEVVYKGNTITVTFNEQNEIVEKLD